MSTDVKQKQKELPDGHADLAKKAHADTWLPMDKAPKDRYIIITDEKKKEEVKSFWRTTRELHNFKWTPVGKWSGAMTYKSLSFEPKYWKEV